MLHSPDAVRCRRVGLLPAAVAVLLAFALGGCGSMAQRLAGNLSAAMMDNDDPAVVEAGSPSYLLLLDALVRQDPKNAGVRQAAAGLNSAYAGAFVKDPRRAAALTEKALNYASEALCLQHDEFCNVRALPVAELLTPKSTPT